MNTHLKHGIAALGLLMAVGAAGATDYTTILTGPNEAPPNDSAAIGAAKVSFDMTAHTLVVNMAFAGLESDSTASHIHCCVAPPGTALVATELPTFTGFPLGVRTGAYSHTFDTSMSSSWNPSFISGNGGTAAGAEAALLAGLNSGTAYINIHSTEYPAGEIRGFLHPVSVVPEPASLALLAAGIPVVALARRRQKARDQRA
jgi:hypothetical protein